MIHICACNNGEIPNHPDHLPEPFFKIDEGLTFVSHALSLSLSLSSASDLPWIMSFKCFS